MFFVYLNEVKGCILLDINTEDLFIERSIRFKEHFLHAPPDQPITTFSSPLIDENGDDTSYQNFV